MHSNSCTPFSCLLSLKKLVLVCLQICLKKLVPPAINLLSPSELRQWGDTSGQHNFFGQKTMEIKGSLSPF
jgi:hypothetical protein